MKHLKFRAWNKIVKRYQYFTLPELVEIKSKIQWHNLVIEQWSGLKDINGVDIYEGDIVYIAGYGNAEIEFPFIDLYDAVMENDIGSIVGNIHEKQTS